MNGFLKFFVPNLPAGNPEWVIASEGLPMGWAFLLFLILTAACVWAYRVFAPGVSPLWRHVLTALRIASVLLFLFLLVKPVLHLTVNEPVRQSLLVLIDASQSMRLPDNRTTPEDLKRLEIASGQSVSGETTLNRWELLERLTANSKLDLWARLQKKSDLHFYSFGREASDVGTLNRDTTAAADAAQLIARLQPQASATGVGEALRQVLEQNAGQAVSGVFLLTDGANNSGLPPTEAARLAKEAGVPLYVYGMGVTSPIDLVMRTIDAPRLAFVKERVDVKAKFQVQGLGRQSTKAVLKANGKPVAETTVELIADGDYEVEFHFEPEETGELVLEASIPILPHEIAKDNNLAEGKLRVVDNQINVLYIEQEPRWDYRYLLAYLQRDRRLKVKCALIDGDPGLGTTKENEESVFLPELPKDREGIFAYEILILGDVSPKDLGEARMKLISEWVSQSNGGIIFLAGPKFDPQAYVGTPLETVLPVIPGEAAHEKEAAERYKEPVPLKLTPTGETSPYMRLFEDPKANAKIWQEFPGVRWTASVLKAKPGAEVLLMDADSPRAKTNGGAMPVIAVQGFGGGEAVFIGTDETYRWRSRVGEKYYSQVWGAIMQSLSLKRLEGASARTQLKASREQYLVGDKIRIAGKVYKEGYEAHTIPTLEGKLTIVPTEADAKSAPHEEPLGVKAVADEPGQYEVEFTAERPGRYTYATLDDPEALIKFEVIEPKVEQMETAMNEAVLKAMAEAAQGHFLREENLDGLPDLIAQQSATVATFLKVRLYESPWWMALLLLFLFSEWLLRRLNQLK